MEITVLCEKATVTTVYSTDRVEVTLEEASLDSVVMGLVENDIDASAQEALLEKIGVDDVSGWLNRKGYLVTDGDGDA